MKGGGRVEGKRKGLFSEKRIPQKFIYRIDMFRISNQQILSLISTRSLLTFLHLTFLSEPVVKTNGSSTTVLSILFQLGSHVYLFIHYHLGIRSSFRIFTKFF